MSRLKIGMISFAHMHAASYLKALLRRDDVDVVGIADEDEERVRPFTEKNGITYYNNYLDLLKEPIDAVVICSENIRHAEITKQCAKFKKHVLCEKPLGICEEEMLEMIKVCEDEGVQLMTAYPCRYLTSVIQAKQIIDRGDIGRIIAMKGTNRGTMPNGWFIDQKLSGGGAVLDHTVHVLDLMRYFTGSEVEEVYAHIDTLFHDVEIDDAGMLHIRFKNGVFAVHDPSWSRMKSFPIWGDVTLEVIGTKGILTVDAFAQKNDVYSDDVMKAEWSYWGDNMDEGLINSFINCLQQDDTVPISGMDGYLSARVALAAYESARTGRPVTL